MNSRVENQAQSGEHLTRNSRLEDQALKMKWRGHCGCDHRGRGGEYMYFIIQKIHITA